ncbi:AAA family ATPase [Chitinophaga sp. GbtcB8]|uniref:AAA family ATPase n=1 Tax=Chitinophaga sp. GbtcB8 TaxID=2824753 RepID=UPI0034CF3189
MINTLIGIIGPTCSGKSTVTRMIQEFVIVDVVSFGKYLYDYSIENNLPTDKPSLQDLGNSFIHGDPEAFLRSVLNHGMTGKKTVLIEGVRHKIIFDFLKKLSANSHFIYVDASSMTRYLRYCERNHFSPEEYTFDQFELMENHIVESEIKFLKEKCDVLIENDVIDINELSTRISSIIEYFNSDVF